MRSLAEIEPTVCRPGWKSWLALPSVSLALVAMGVADDFYVVYTTPQGTYRLETLGNDDPKVLVSIKGAAERKLLAGANSQDPDECTATFTGSPDEQWIFYTESWRHHAVQDRTLYHHQTGANFVPYKGGNWFAEGAQAFAIKNGGFKHSDFYTQRAPKVFEDHFHAMSRGWSSDSARLLISIVATADFREDMAKRFYVYFNARMKTFELTPYLRALNRLRAKDENEAETPCPEPVDPLPDAEKLKARADQAEKELQELFAYRIEHPKEQTAEEWKDEQRQRQEKRAAGLKLYLQFAPKKEVEARRLEFLADTAIVERADVESERR